MFIKVGMYKVIKEILINFQRFIYYRVHSVIIELNQKPGTQVFRNFLNTWKLNNTSLSNPWLEDETIRE